MNNLYLQQLQAIMLFIEQYDNLTQRKLPTLTILSVEPHRKILNFWFFLKLNGMCNFFDSYKKTYQDTEYKSLYKNPKHKPSI